jgi:hypothetical protein
VSPLFWIVRLFAALEAHMAKPKLEISLSPIAAQIDKAKKKMESLRPRVSAADQKDIDLEITELLKCRKELAAFCRKMTHAFKPALKK